MQRPAFIWGRFAASCLDFGAVSVDFWFFLFIQVYLVFFSFFMVFQETWRMFSVFLFFQGPKQKKQKTASTFHKKPKETEKT